ncbi:hypothetical protein [Streptomyces sp. NPDC048665]|uniref:hypothetical protein n=1 Tax=Streptomyces sp. NPDC048665 TaxID=3155490 RepID=UPI0034490A44
MKATSGPESIHAPMLSKGGSWSHTFTRPTESPPRPACSARSLLLTGVVAGVAVLCLVLVGSRAGP